LTFNTALVNVGCIGGTVTKYYLAPTSAISFKVESTKYVT
jgi:hypothetical protein